ncbi:hypothetical protein KAR91_18370, partial [Candidatus Pacearchaeota archaeon]|nr:hypothetical protein [Candidatus Pacearchaeota archaeon]
KIQGWVSVGEGNEDKYHRSAFEQEQNLPDGTYELIGEKVQGNPEKITGHTLINHANADKYPDFPHNFEGIKAVLKNTVIEGIVWHHPDGRMVKIKRKDFYR